MSVALPPRNLAFVSDGTLSSWDDGAETNAGRLAKLLREVGATRGQDWFYDRGIQGEGWRRWLHAATGEGINTSICRGYGWLASRYRHGDRIFLFGFSRGAYAVRSLAGMIGRIGLLRREHASERHVMQAFRLYQKHRLSRRDKLFRQQHCDLDVPVEMLGVWDTVKALGLPYPALTYLHPAATEFHDHELAPHIRHGYHALAIDEDRRAYTPILWTRTPDWQGRLEQCWFSGAHADIGGEVRRLPEARGLSNIPLNWMLRRAERHGLTLPDGWGTRFPEDPAAPAHGNRRGPSRGFLIREPRVIGLGDGEVLHLSIRERQAAVSGYRPRAVSRAAETATSAGPRAA